MTDCTTARITAKDAIERCVVTASNHVDLGFAVDLQMALIDIHNKFDKKTLKETHTKLTLLLAKLSEKASKSLRKQLSDALACVTYAIETCN